MSINVSQAEGQVLWQHSFAGPLGAAPDTAVWNFEIGDGTDKGIPGWGNQELEFYTKENATLNGTGQLVISAIRNENPEYEAYYGGPAKWLSARMHTQSKVEFLYGKLEIRAKFASGLGTWPAIWMLGSGIAAVGWPSCGEIDIAEGRGDQPATLYTTVHGPGYSGEFGAGVTNELPTHLAAEFQTYSLEWLPDRLTWKINGEVMFELTPAGVAGDWVFNQPHFLILNLAMGGHFTGPVADDLASAQMEVDFIRHSQIGKVGQVFINPAD